MCDQKISKVIDTINEHDQDSIVIFQSDHNWRMSTKSESEFEIEIIFSA